MYFGILTEFQKYALLISESLLVVVLSVIFFLLKHKTPFRKLNWVYQQIIIGLVFGGAAIFGTELGIDIESSIINVRDAAPLTAGLIFGGPAGMIAAVIGSFWRLISSLYPPYKGYYAMVACCLGTLLSGAYAWALRKWFFEEKTPNFLFGFASAAIMEVLHFILLYLTHIRDPQTILDIIYEITVVMIVANGVGVSLSCLVIGLLENGFSIKVFRSRERTINSRIQLHLLILILVTAFSSTSFVTIIQNNYANETADQSLLSNISDMSTYINEYTDSEMQLYTTYAAAKFNSPDSALDHDLNLKLQSIKNSHVGISHINVIAYDTEDGHEEGEVLYSTDAALIGRNLITDYDRDDMFQTAHYIIKGEINDEQGEPIIPRHYEHNFFESNIYQQNIKVATFSLLDIGGINGYIEVATTPEDFFNSENPINDVIKELTKHRRVYLTGFMIVLDRNGEIVSFYYDTEPSINFTIDDVDINKGFNPYQTYTKRIYDEDSFYIYTDYETYYIVGAVPKTDVTVGRNMMIIVYSFMLTFIYASIFFVSYILIKQLIIKNLRKINNSLNLIIQGDLDQKVDVHSSQEFIDLSNDINITVDTLKDFIKEAEERIDKELAFARTIQSSSLPSVFPPFPGVKEFDIYATMNTAREVGGDFYDFYFLDADRFAFLVADVSGKGIPASMFMMESKALLKNTSLAYSEVDQVFNKVNASLCQGNDANMFVTCWMGIVNVTTGVVEFVNAGHNAPLLYKRSTGTWEYLNEHKDVVLAGLDNTVYHKQTIKLHPGDKIYLYTDGVTEATRRDKVLYGERRLQNYLNKFKNFDQYKLLEGIQKDIDKFIDGADQFDDITMLVFDFKKYRK